MTRRFGRAIRDAGMIVRIPGEAGKEFSASIQPLRTDGNGHAETGTGCLRQYKMYAVCDEVTVPLREGNILECNGVQYLVESMETLYFGDNPVFRQGILVAGQEGEA